MKYTTIVKPSTTDVTVIIDIPDATAEVKPALPDVTTVNGTLVITPKVGTVSVSQQPPVITQTPGTPPVVVDPPPVVTPPTTGIPASAKLLFASDFSNGFTGFQTVSGGIYAQLGRGVIATDNGNKVFNAIVNAGDKPISSGFRSELTLDTVPMQGEMYFSFRAKFLKYPGSDQGHFFQIHPSNDTGSAAFAIYFSGNNFSVIRSLKKGENIYEKPSKPYTLNQWYNFTLHIKWSSSADGFAQVYIDDKLFLDIKGQTLPAEGGYLKYGANMWSGRTGLTPDTGINIMYDDLKIFKA